MNALRQLFASAIEPPNVLGTCFDAESVLHEKYGDESRDNIDNCVEAGYDVMYSVDATALASIRLLKNKIFNKIVFNFPHSGAGIKDKV
jgi:25S rRNA (uracil2634-N3)-methyltransferase